MKKEYELDPGGLGNAQEPKILIIGQRPRHPPYVNVTVKEDYVGSLYGCKLTAFMKSLCRALGYRAVKQ